MGDLGDDLIEAMQEVAAYMRGDLGKIVTSTVDVPRGTDVMPEAEKIDLCGTGPIRRSV
jgi:hypothetical protein